MHGALPWTGIPSGVNSPGFGFTMHLISMSYLKPQVHMCIWIACLRREKYENLHINLTVVRFKPAGAWPVKKITCAVGEERRMSGFSHGVSLHPVMNHGYAAGCGHQEGFQRKCSDGRVCLQSCFAFFITGLQSGNESARCSWGSCTQLDLDYFNIFISSQTTVPGNETELRLEWGCQIVKN